MLLDIDVLGAEMISIIVDKMNCTLAIRKYNCGHEAQ